MKTMCVLSSAMLVLMSSSVSAYGALIDRGNGLIYETDLNITWLQNANLAANQTFGVSGILSTGQMTGDTADAWIAAMNAADYKGFNDWRLPIGNANQCLGVSCIPFSIFGSELANLYYTELGNAAGGPLTNTAPFNNVQSFWYWGDSGSGMPSPEGTVFHFGIGSQTNVVESADDFYAWAVRTGDVLSTSVPEPAAIAIFGCGFALLAARKAISAFDRC
jgi:hypothetical protein